MNPLDTAAIEAVLAHPMGPAAVIAAPLAFIITFIGFVCGLLVFVLSSDSRAAGRGRGRTLAIEAVIVSVVVSSWAWAAVASNASDNAYAEAVWRFEASGACERLFSSISEGSLTWLDAITAQKVRSTCGVTGLADAANAPAAKLVVAPMGRR